MAADKSKRRSYGLSSSRIDITIDSDDECGNICQSIDLNQPEETRLGTCIQACAGLTLQKLEEDFESEADFRKFSSKVRDSIDETVKLMQEEGVLADMAGDRKQTKLNPRNINMESEIERLEKDTASLEKERREWECEMLHAKKSLKQAENVKLFEVDVETLRSWLSPEDRKFLDDKPDYLGIMTRLKHRYVRALEGTEKLKRLNEYLKSVKETEMEERKLAAEDAFRLRVGPPIPQPQADPKELVRNFIKRGINKIKKKEDLLKGHWPGYE